MSAALNYACVDGDLPLVIRLIEQEGCPVNGKAGWYDTPLHCACFADKYEVIEYLLSKGADVNLRNRPNETPLMSACTFKANIRAIDLLIKHGADVNARDNEGRTPLYATCIHGEYEKTELLLKNGAQNTTDVFGLTPLSVACRASRVEIARLLLKYGAREIDHPIVHALRDPLVDMMESLTIQPTD